MAERTLVTFKLDRRTYALPIEPIVQIIEMVTLTPIPQVASSVKGVINVRGAPVPVIGLRDHLGLPAAELDLHTPIMLVQAGQRLIGLIVDQVMDVIRAGQATQLADVLPDGFSDAPPVQELVHAADDTVLVFDLERLLSHHQADLTRILEAMPTSSPPEAQPDLPASPGDLSNLEALPDLPAGQDPPAQGLEATA